MLHTRRMSRHTGHPPRSCQSVIFDQRTSYTQHRLWRSGQSSNGVSAPHGPRFERLQIIIRHPCSETWKSRVASRLSSPCLFQLDLLIFCAVQHSRPISCHSFGHLPEQFNLSLWTDQNCRELTYYWLFVPRHHDRIPVESLVLRGHHCTHNPKHTPLEFLESGAGFRDSHIITRTQVGTSPHIQSTFAFRRQILDI